MSIYSNIKFQNVLKNVTKKRKCVTLLTFSSKQREILQTFYPSKDFFTQTLFARLSVFASLS